MMAVTPTYILCYFKNYNYFLCKKVSLAALPTGFVAITSNRPPTTPPKRGTAFPKLIIPFSGATFNLPLFQSS